MVLLWNLDIEIFGIPLQSYPRRFGIWNAHDAFDEEEHLVGDDDHVK